jgi:glycine cleavage system H protein
MYPQTYRYTKDHEWIEVTGGSAKVGITDYAQKHLGDAVYVELPALGTKLAVHQTIGTIESVKAVSEIYSPVSGEVIEVNGELNASPEAVNQDPHGKGWILRLKLSAPSDVAVLMDAAAYEKYVAGLEG